MSANERPSGGGEPVLAWIERRTATARQREVEFDDPRLEYRRLFSEVGHVPAGPGRGRRGGHRRDGVWQPADLADEGPGPGHDGDGDHLFHGYHLWRPPQPRGHAGVRGAGQLPLASGPGLHRCRGRRCRARGLVPAADVRRDHQRGHRADQRCQHLGGDADRGRAHPGAGQCHLGHRFGCPQRKDQRRHRRGAYIGLVSVWGRRSRARR